MKINQDLFNLLLFRFGENDVEYSNNMDLEEGELADSAGASGNSH